MLYVQLDTNWPDHPKIVRAGWEAAGIHAAVMCLSKRTDKDGWVDRFVLERRYGIASDVLDRLIDLDLLEAEGNNVRPDGWLDRNPSQAAIDAKRASKVDAARRGNHAKWKHPDDFLDCTICNPLPQVVAGSDRTSSQDDPVAIRGDRTPTKSESESEVTTAIASRNVHPLEAQAALRAEQVRVAEGGAA